MSKTVIMLDPVEKGVYALPESIGFFPDEPMESLDTLVEPTQERGKLLLRGKTYMITVYVEHSAGIRLPHMLVSDLERLI